MALHRVPIGEVRDLIRAGEALPFHVHDALDRLLLSAGQRVDSERQVESLIERGAWVERDLVVAQRAKRQQGAAGGAPLASGRRVSLFDRWERALWNVDALLRRTAKGLPTGPELAAEADAVLELVDRDVDIALFLAVRQEDRRFALYPLAHALHSAVLAAVAARQAQWEEPRRHGVVAAALTMNIAMLELQATLAEQDEPPTQRQLEQIRAHPLRGAALLQAAGVTDEAWLRTVREHHERGDGGGYPEGLTAPCEEARLLRMADVYMAKITPRVGRAPLPPQAASRQLFQQEGTSPLAMAMIKAVGIHPPGCLVQLKSGEVAVVKRRGSGPAPLVCTLSDRHGKPSVNSTTIDTHEAEHAITGPLLDHARFARVLPERIYGVVEG